MQIIAARITLQKCHFQRFGSYIGLLQLRLRFELDFATNNAFNSHFNIPFVNKFKWT